MRGQKIVCLWTALAVLVTASGCAARPQTEQAPQAAEKTVVTMMYYNHLDNFIDLVESTYDDIQIDYEVSAIGRFNSDGERRLRNGHGVDLILTTLPTGGVAEYALDLSAYDFATRYQAATMNSVKRDGQVIYVPLPGSYFGYIVNETLVDELGMPLPASRQEFLALLRAAKERGVGLGEDGAVMGLSNVDGSTVGNMIIGMAVPDFLGLLAGETWAADFMAKKAAFAGGMAHCLDDFLELTGAGYITPERLDGSRNVTDVSQRLSAGTMLCCFGTSLYLEEMRQSTEQYSFTMLPFFSAQGKKPWVSACPSAYMTINKALEEAGNEAKLDACVRILELLSTPEGQQAILADTGTDTSFLTEEVTGVKRIETGLEECVAQGYVYNNRLPSDAVWSLGVQAVRAAAGEQSAAEALTAVDNAYLYGDALGAAERTLVGGVAEDLLLENYDVRKRETALGNLVADCVAEAGDVPIALVNGGGIRASLYAGDVYLSDLQAAAPYDNTIVVVEMSGKTLLEVLANAITGIHYQEISHGKFLQVHGLVCEIAVDPATEKSKYEPAAAKLVRVTLSDGTPIESDSRYTVAVNSYMCGAAGYLDGAGDGYTMLNLFSDTAPLAEDVKLIADTKWTYADALYGYFLAHNDREITAQLEGRIIVKGEPAQ